MKRRMIAVLFVLVILAGAAYADAVTPATTNIVNVRGEAVTTIGGTYYMGSTLLITNAYCLVGGTGSNTQGLDGITVQLTVGNSASNVVVTGTVYVASGATNRYAVSFTVPTVTGTCNIQTKITDASSNIFIYPWKRLTVKTAL